MMDRSERRRRTRMVVAKRRKLLEDTGTLFESAVTRGGILCPDRRNLTDREWEKKCHRQVGMCRKKKPFDCGKSRCFVCGSYSREIYGPTLQELKSSLDFAEQVSELEMLRGQEGNT